LFFVALGLFVSMVLREPSAGDTTLEAGGQAIVQLSDATFADGPFSMHTAAQQPTVVLCEN
jgi:hypothetical protein